jgi:precorrin-4 methylase/DMSO/TMAO reductase YedYZ molybdopterin-dependent catalytic subunit
MKKNFSRWVTWVVICLVCAPWSVSASSLAITGLVRQPLNLTRQDLNGFDSIRVQFNEVRSDGSFQGVFHYSGIPLKFLLELTGVEKEETAFGKKVDLAIRVRNKKGNQVALSWGEVFYRNPGGIIVGTSASPIMPHKNCRRCHDPEVYQPRLDEFQRKIGFPKLVISSDNYSDRSLEEISSIEVLDLRPKMPAKKLKKLYTSEFMITGAIKNDLTIKELDDYPRREITVTHLGEGRGYHGIDRFGGVPFKAILDKVDIAPDLSNILLVSAPDGYRSLFSYGEIFLNPSGDRMILADKIKGQPIKHGGKFILVPPDDLMSDREVKAVQKIEVISLHKEPKVYVIGMGCGDTNLISLKAISYLAKVDVYVCPPDIKDRFSKYMGDKPVLLDIYQFAPPRLKKKNPGLSQEKIDELMNKERRKAITIISETLDKGKSVGVLDYGDPTIWSGWSWIQEYFSDDGIEIIAGLSSFNVSNALIKRSMGCNGSIILTTSRGIMENKSMLKALAEKGETLCIFMGLKDIGMLDQELKKYYKDKTPVYLAYKSGYSGSEHLIQTTLDSLQKAVDGYHEKFLGLIYVGPCLVLNKKELCH